MGARSMSVFTSLADLEDDKTLFVQVWATPKSGKSTFVVGNKRKGIPSFPKPIYILNYDLGLKELVESVAPEDREGIYFVDLVGEGTDLDEVQAYRVLSRAESGILEAVKAIKATGQGTIAIDTITTHWELVQICELASAKKNKEGKPYRYEYGNANARYRQTLMALKSIPGCNVVLLQYAKEVYDNQGQATGTFEPHGNKQTAHMAPITIQLYRDDKKKPPEYGGIITFCRQRQEIAGIPYRNINYKSLWNLIYNEDDDE